MDIIQKGEIMKEMFKYMENTCDQSVKHLCIIYIILLIVQCTLGLMNPNSDALVYYFLMAIGFIAVNRIHVHRLNSLIKDGAINRIRLIPMNWKSFLHSELLFTGVSYALLIVVQQLVIAVLYLPIKDQFHFLGNTFWLYLLDHQAAFFFMPFSLLHLVMMIIVVCIITIVFTFLHVSIALDSKNCGISVILLFILVIVTFMEYLFGSFILMLIYMMIGFIAYQLLKSAFGVRRQSKWKK